MISSELPNGALIDELTQSRFGEDALSEVLANLWDAWENVQCPISPCPSIHVSAL